MTTILSGSNHRIIESIQKIQASNAEYHKAKSAFQSIDQNIDHLLSLVKVENGRDYRRMKRDRKDKCHDRWLNITNVASAVTPFLVAGAAVLALKVGLNPDQQLSPYVYVIAASAAGLTSATRGKGFLAMKLQDADFAQKNGEYHDKRRSRAYDIEAFTKIRFFEKKNAIREQNDQLALSELYAVHKWMLKRKVQKLDKKKNKIDKYIAKMDKRDQKTRYREHKDGKESSYDFNRTEAKLTAINRMLKKGFPQELVYKLVDPEGELPKPNQESKKKSIIAVLGERVDRVPLAKRIRNKKEVLPPETVFQRMGRQMLEENCFNFSAISNKIGYELNRFEEKIINA